MKTQESIGMKNVKRSEKEKAKLRRDARIIHERSLLLQAVLHMRKIARMTPDDHMFFVSACDDVLESISRKKNEKRRERVFMCDSLCP